MIVVARRLQMPVWWVGLVGVVLLGAGLISSIDGLVAAGALSLLSAVLGLVFGLMRRR